jgi:hypothetical protein
VLKSTRAARSGLGWFAPVNASPKPAMRPPQHSHGGRRDPRAIYGRRHRGTVMIAGEPSREAPRPPGGQTSGCTLPLIAAARRSPGHRHPEPPPRPAGLRGRGRGRHPRPAEDPPPLECWRASPTPAGFLLPCQDDRIWRVS